MITQPGELTDRQIFFKVAARAIVGIVCWGVAAAVVIFTHWFLPRIATIAAVPLILIFLVNALWTLGGLALGALVWVGRAFGAWANQPYSASHLWAAHGVRCGESVIYLAYSALLYRLVLAS